RRGKPKSKRCSRGFRLKLAAMHRDYIAAINAVRDYRDLRIDLNKLKKLTSPHIIFLDLDSGLRIENVIPEKFMPRLTEAALRDASATMQNDPSEKLKWLQVVRELLKADSGIDLLLLMEQSATLAQQTSPVEILDDNKRLDKELLETRQEPGRPGPTP